MYADPDSGPLWHNDIPLARFLEYYALDGSLPLTQDMWVEAPCKAPVLMAVFREMTSLPSSAPSRRLGVRKAQKRAPPPRSL